LSDKGQATETIKKKGKKPRPLTKKQREEALKKAKGIITDMFKKNMDTPLPDIQNMFPDVSIRVITGIKGHLKNPGKKDLTQPNIGIPPALAEANPATKQAFAEAFAEGLAQLGLSPDRVTQLAEALASGNIPGKTAPFTPEKQLGQGDPAEKPPELTRQQLDEQDRQNRAIEDARPITQGDFKTFMEKLPDIMRSGVLSTVREIGIDGAVDEVVETKKIQIDAGSAVARTIYCTPKTLIYFDLSKTDERAPYAGDLSEWFNHIIEMFFEKKNMKLGFMNTREL